MSASRCVGNPTLNEAYGGAFSEWPEHIPGYVCMTPPFGSRSAPRFAECCSGPLYNITSPTSPDDPAYPVACAMFCQIDPALAVSNDSYPYGWDEHFMCLTNGGTISGGGEVFCDTITVKGTPAPTSFISTPTGFWQTKTYVLDENGFPAYNSLDQPLTVAESSDLVSETASPTSLDASTILPTTTVESSGESTATVSVSHSILSSTSSLVSETPANPTSTSTAARPSLQRITVTLLAISMLCVRALFQ